MVTLVDVCGTLSTMIKADNIIQCLPTKYDDEIVSKIIFDNNDWIAVKETPLQIYDKIQRSIKGWT